MSEEVEKRPYRPLKLTDADDRTPAPQGLGKWAENLRNAAYNAVNESDVEELIKTMMGKAKAGDVSAAKFVLGFLTGGPPKVQIQKIVIRDRRPRKVKSVDATPVAGDGGGPPLTPAPAAMLAVPTMKVYRRLAALFLLANGPSPADAVANNLEMENAQAADVLNCDWFKGVKGKIELTPAGRQAVG